ncbi:unnamed protein product [Natator depressus]
MPAVYSPKSLKLLPLKSVRISKLNSIEAGLDANRIQHSTQPEDTAGYSVIVLSHEEPGICTLIILSTVINLFSIQVLKQAIQNCKVMSDSRPGYPSVDPEK